tara:strand:- start:227 stop:673 length:447 start_codon:yes stop_codon:yes gene_type:complete
MAKVYKLEPKLTKSSYDEEIYTKTIDGQDVEITVVSYHRWSEFEITLTESQKKEILLKDEIILSDYDIEFISSDDCFKMDSEIKDENKYSEKFISKIVKHIYGPDEDDDDDDDDESLCEGGIDALDENGWSSGDVTYGLTCNCTLSEI